MIHFLNTPAGSTVAVEIDHTPTIDELSRIAWLLGEATVIDADAIEGYYIGPRREMLTPWSTNAVEITQNMGLQGIQRIEEYFPVASEDADYDPMLQRLYKGLDQQLFTSGRTAEAIRHITNLEEYNEQEGLALSAEEIDYLNSVSQQLARPLTDSEVFGFAQINSEHCRHKIFGGTFIIDGQEMPSSLFAMIKKTTELHRGKIISAYKDNVAFVQGPVVEQFAPADHSQPDFFQVKEVESVISIKAETHNFPTTVEPFNGASTGTGGEIRDRMGGGTGSMPIAGTAVYMTASPRSGSPRKWLYQTPEQILIKASNGASDFGNKFGQPLICGSVLTFEHNENEERYGYDKVIMLAGGVGWGTKRDALKGTPEQGNKIVVMGGDNYRIGLGGGSVSSVDTGRYSSGIELNAVQRANAEMQKRVYNVVRALCEEDTNPIVSIHDHGSAGHVNCLSELVEECGGVIEMDKLPIGDSTLSAKEIIANESQERMGLLIREEAIPHVRAIAERERAPMYVVGTTTGDARFVFQQKDGVRPFDLSVEQMFGSSPKTVMIDKTVVRTYKDIPDSNDFGHCLAAIGDVVRLEAVACKDWLTNKVDRSVTGRVAQQQCVGELQLPLADCGVVALDFQFNKGIATSIGHAPQAGLANAANGSVLSVAEALTNIVFAPLADGLAGVSLSANWMWPCRSQDGEDARLYSAVKALSDFCIAIGINVPTGKDSLSMTQKYPDGTKVIAPGTVIVSAGGEVSDVRGVVTPVIQAADSSHTIYIDFSSDELRLGGSAYAQSQGYIGSDVPTVKDAGYFKRAFTAVQALIAEGVVLAGHDVSAGGLLTTLLEMNFANVAGGLNVELSAFGDAPLNKILFAENPAVVLQVSDKDKAEQLLAKAAVKYAVLGQPIAERKLHFVRNGEGFDVLIDDVRKAWFEPSYILDIKQSLNGCAEERCDNIFNSPLQWQMPAHFTGQCAVRSGEMTGVRAAIIREKGTNGEREMAYMLYLAGFDVKDVTMTDLVSGRETLDDVNFIVFCGGFSNSDVLGSAKGWAGAFLFNEKAKETLDRFYARPDTLSLGICNGCQLLIELGLITPDHAERPRMLHNTSHKFESAFLGVTVQQNDTVLFGSLSGAKLGVWVAHGEGKFSLPYAEQQYNIAVKYSYSDYPANPNGSDYDVAALASADGRHIAMMPHLERAFLPWQCASYPTARRTADTATPWLEAFVNARKWIAAQ